VIPIHSLLDRIRWDPDFGHADFIIGYYDRVKRSLVQVPFARIQFDPGNRFSFAAVEADGSVHEVPLHRVREVHRNGELIWRRPPRRGLPEQS
jgi:uncharacterized protein (UPF0248 family)